MSCYRISFGFSSGLLLGRLRLNFLPVSSPLQPVVGFLPVNLYFFSSSKIISFFFFFCVTVLHLTSIINRCPIENIWSEFLFCIYFNMLKNMHHF